MGTNTTYGEPLYFGQTPKYLLEITVATCAAVWNSHPSGTVAVVAGLLLLANGYVIFRKAKAMSQDIENNGITNN